MHKLPPFLALAVLSLAAALHAQQPTRPMAPDANPSFEVATVKLSNPETHYKNFSFEGHHVWAIDYTVNDMLALAYGVHPKQIIGAPDWFGTTLYDIDGIPDTPGIPNQQQKNLMMQKLLTDRFAFKFHYEKRTLAVYAITIANGGPKLTQSTSGPNDPDLYRFKNGLRGVAVTNMTLSTFAVWFQKTVMDKPVIDRSGLTGRYTFELNWTPDDSQFIQMRSTGISPTPPSPNNPNPRPGLFTAIQEQLGLRLKAIRAPTNVIVIDHAERPSPN